MTARPAHFVGILRRFSRVRYTLWRLLGGKGPIDLRLASGLRLHMRSLATTDYDVAWQIFWRCDYESPRPLRDVRVVVDLGANIGYSCLYWCQQYPQCHVTALEPHPVHVGLIRENLRRNGFTDRVKIIAAAAGSRERRSYLSDARTSSSVSEEQSAFQIRVLDIFTDPELKGNIDLLKIDIEGGEYELLSDPRFAELEGPALVVEWHNTPEHPDGRTWCLEKLKSLKYRVEDGAQDPPSAGLLWAYRDC
jgi:FkbM family methyltransferase